MKMQKRTNLVVQFSSFLCLKEESSSLTTYWKKYPELERNIKLLQQQQIISSEEDIIAQEFLRWLKKNQDLLQHRHLIAYLQESCFFATHKVYQKLHNYWHLFTWQDYFQWANLLVSSPVKLLLNYDSNLGLKLSTYAKNKIELQLMDEAYKYMSWERASDWGLLKQLKSNNQRKCLQNIGALSGINLEKYLLIWYCFNLLYKPPIPSKNQKLLPPSLSHFIQVTDEYNFLITKKNSELSPINSQQCESILLNCIKYARQYCNPKIVFNNTYLDNLADDKIVDFNNDEPTRTNYNLVNKILSETFSQFSLPQKIIFQLWKGIELTQTEIVTVMSVNYPNFVSQQFHVAREINSMRKILLESLIEGVLLQHKIKLTQDKVSELKTPLDIWLQKHCKEIIGEKISLIYQSLPIDEKEKIKEYLITKDWNLNQDIESELCEKMAIIFQNNMKLEFKLIFPETQKIKLNFIHVIQEWINESVYLFINNS